MTKQAIVTLILNELGLPYEHELYERLSDRVLALRAKFLRQSIGRYGIDELLQQTYVVKTVKKKDISGCVYFETECRIAMPIRAIGSASPFKFVGTVDNIPYTFLRIYETHTIPTIPVNVLNKYYSIENGKIRIYNTSATSVKITDIFESLEDLIDMCGAVDCDIDDNMELLMPSDFVDDIITKLVTEFRQLNVPIKEGVDD